MIATLAFWLLAAYGFIAILLQWMTRNNEYYQKAEVWEVQLLLRNSEMCLERTIRSLIQLSRLKGQPMRLIVYDYGSTDQTKQILAAFQKKHPYLFERAQIVAKESFEFVSIENDDSRLTIDLRQGLDSGTFQTT